MELRHLRYFLAVAEELNFSRAAERLHIAQPPLSQQIRQLEDELGLQLLERGSRPLRLTDAGSFFRTEARQILAELDDAVIGTRRIGRGQTGWLGVSYVTSAMSTPIQPALRRFHAEHPNVAVLLFEMLAAEQEAALLDRRAHVGFLRSTFDHEQLVEELLYDDPFVVAVPSDHRLGQRVAMRIAGTAQSTPTCSGAHRENGVAHFKTNGHAISKRSAKRTKNHAIDFPLTRTVSVELLMDLEAEIETERERSLSCSASNPQSRRTNPR